MKLTKDHSPNFVKFFEWACDYLKLHNKKLKIGSGKFLKLDGSRCAGWCDENEIAIARENPLFERVFVHEFSHMQQVVEGSPYWTEDSIWDHLIGMSMPLKSWDAVFETIILERDCEKRSIEHSKKWNLFDNYQYAKRTNIYLYYYQYIFLTGKWVNSVNIYRPALLSIMPDYILPVTEYKNINMEMMLLFDENLNTKNPNYRK